MIAKEDKALYERIKKLNKEQPLRESTDIQKVLNPADADAFEQHEKALADNEKRKTSLTPDVKDFIEETAGEKSRYRHLDVVDRKELAKVLNEAQKEKVKYRVSRNLKEGYRYSVELKEADETPLKGRVVLGKDDLMNPGQAPSLTRLASADITKQKEEIEAQKAEELSSKYLELIKGKSSSDAIDILFREFRKDNIIPDSGASKCVSAEIISAVSKLGYRWYNDGDVPFFGYGLETAGDALTYLINKIPSVEKLCDRLDKESLVDYDRGLEINDSKVESFMQSLFKAVIDFLLTDEGKLTFAQEVLEGESFRDCDVYDLVENQPLFDYEDEASGTVATAIDKGIIDRYDFINAVQSYIDDNVVSGRNDYVPSDYSPEVSLGWDSTSFVVHDLTIDDYNELYDQITRDRKRDENFPDPGYFDMDESDLEAALNSEEDSEEDEVYADDDGNEDKLVDESFKGKKEDKIPAGDPTTAMKMFNKATDVGASSPTTGLGEGMESDKWQYAKKLNREVNDMFAENELYPDYAYFSVENKADCDYSFELDIDGDWKHDHMFAEHLMDKFFEEHGLEIVNVHEQTTDTHGGDDSYASTYSYDLKKADEGEPLHEELKVYTSKLDGFEPSTKAADFWKEIKDEGKVEDLEYALESLYPDGISDVALDDLLYHEEDWIRDLIGMDSKEPEDEETISEEEPEDEADEEVPDSEDDEDVEPVDLSDYVSETDEDEDEGDGLKNYSEEEGKTEPEEQQNQDLEDEEETKRKGRKSEIVPEDGEDSDKIDESLDPDDLNSRMIKKASDERQEVQDVSESQDGSHANKNLEAVFVGGPYDGKVVSHEELEKMGNGKFTIRSSVLSQHNDKLINLDLEDQPLVDGYLSPMLDGGRLRYETQDVYDILSEGKEPCNDSDKDIEQTAALGEAFIKNTRQQQNCSDDKEAVKEQVITKAQEQSDESPVVDVDENTVDSMMGAPKKQETEQTNTQNTQVSNKVEQKPIKQ